MGSDGCKTAFTNPDTTFGHTYLSTTVRDRAFTLSNWELPGDTNSEQKAAARAQTHAAHGLKATGLGQLAPSFGA